MVERKLDLKPPLPPNFQLS
jgi:ATP sulfurylase